MPARRTNGTELVIAQARELESLGEKALSEEQLRQGERRSVVEPDPNRLNGFGDRLSFLFVAGYSDGIPAWGSAPIARDIMLRQFVTRAMESTTTSAIATIVGRNCVFDWALDGPSRSVQASLDMLHRSNNGQGWISLIAKTSLDLLTCDLGTFIEIVREEDSPQAPIYQLNHLDATKCWPTGDPVIPVIYTDRNGRWHQLKWYQVMHLLELPVGVEELPAMQICAMTRILRAAQLYRSIQTYNEEKIGGRFTRAIHLVSGISQKQLDDAMALHNIRADTQLLTRYTQPMAIAAVDPEHPPVVASFEMASLPDGFNAEEEFKKFLTVLAMGLLSDYQEFAPLPGGNLGTSTQSEILHLKARGKGPGLFMKLWAHSMNYHGALPRNVHFRFDEQDVEADKAKAEAALARAQVRNQMLLNGEIDAQGSLQMALDAGDITPEVYAAMSSRPDITGDNPVSDMGTTIEDSDTVVAKSRNKKKEDQELGAREEVEDATTDEFSRVMDRVMRSIRRVSKN